MAMQPPTPLPQFTTYTSIHIIPLSLLSFLPLSFPSSVTFLPLPQLHAVPVIVQQTVSVAVVVQVLSFVYFNAKLHRHCEKSLIGDFLACLYTDIYIHIYIFTHVIGLNMYW